MPNQSWVQERNKETARSFLRAINEQRWEDAARLVTADFVRHSDSFQAPTIRTRQAFHSFLVGEAATFPDAQEEILFLFAERDHVAARLRFTATQMGPLGPFPASGRRVSAQFTAIFRFEDGHIAEAWAEWDSLKFLAELGHIQAPA